MVSTVWRKSSGFLTETLRWLSPNISAKFQPKFSKKLKKYIIFEKFVWILPVKCLAHFTEYPPRTISVGTSLLCHTVGILTQLPRHSKSFQSHLEIIWKSCKSHTVVIHKSFTSHLILNHAKVTIYCHTFSLENSNFGCPNFPCSIRTLGQEKVHSCLTPDFLFFI